MAQFTPYQNDQKDPSYLNWSKEGDAAKTTSMLANVLKGVGDLGDLAVKAADQVTKRAWQDELTDPILGEKKKEQEDYWKLVNQTANPNNTPPGATGASTASISQGGTRAEVAFQNSTQELPVPVTRAMREQEKITQAFNMGHLGDAGYNARMQDIIQGVASRYPGYADQIRTYGSHLVGHDPADALRGALQSTLKTLMTSGKDEGDKWTNEVMLHYAQVFDPTKDGGDTIKRMLSARTPEEQMFWRDWAGKRIASIHKTSNTIQEFNLKDAQGKATSEDAQKALSDAGSQLVTNIFNGLDHHGEAVQFKAGNYTADVPSALKEVQKMQQTVEAGGPESEALRGKVGSVLGQARTMAELQLDQMAKASGLARNMKPREFDALKKQILSPFDTIAAQVGAGYMTSATMNATLLAAAQNNSALKVMSDPYMRLISGVSEVAKAGANQVLGVMNTADTWKNQTRSGQNLLQMQMHEMLLPPNAKESSGTGVGGKVTLADGIDRYKTVAAAEGRSITPPPEYMWAMANTLREALVNPNVPISTKIEAARALSDPSTDKFLQILKPDQKITAFQRLYDPQVTPWMKGQGGQVWDQYRTTGALLFRQSMNSYLDTFKTSVSNGIIYNVRWDNQAQQIYYDTREKQPGTNLSYGSTYIDPAVQAVNKINTALGTYKNVLKEDNKTITIEELNRLGINLASPTKDKSFKDIVDTLRSIPSDKETKTNSTPVGRQKKSDNLTVPSDTEFSNVIERDGTKYVLHNDNWYKVS